MPKWSNFSNACRVMGRLTICASITTIISCETTPFREAAPIEDPCHRLDWYEVGRRDGQQGLTLDTLDAHKLQCQASTNPPRIEAYLNGRNAGLNEYCLPQNGFQVGRRGTAYKNVCPPHMENDFLKQYSYGQTVQIYEAENSELLKRILKLQAQIRADSKSPAAANTQDLRKELNELGKRLSSNELSIGNLEIESEAPTNSSEAK